MVVVNWNRRDLLLSCLESLALQTHRSFEVIVIDNGSDDGSAESVKTLVPTYPIPLRLISNPDNRGFLIFAYVPAFIGLALLVSALFDAVVSRKRDPAGSQPPKP